MSHCDVIIVGAGPYGLSAAAHLRSVGIESRVFGDPMKFWATAAPSGMLLRSPREASTISDPLSSITLEDYEAATNTMPVRRVASETFIDYGRWFYERAGIDLDTRHVTHVSHEGQTYKVTLMDGAEFTANRVIVAAGIGPFLKTPDVLSHLPSTHASHCYQGRPLDKLGKRVAVIGAGQSALESAALLHEAGIEVEVIARNPVLRWVGMHKRLHQMGILSRVLYSKHDVGPIGISRLVAYPNLMRRVPLGVKDKIRARAIRAAGASWLVPRLQNVKITTGRSVRSAEDMGGEVRLTLDDGSERHVDHVLSGTGYRVDISRYQFLAPALLQQIRQLDGYPDLGAGFCASVPGLHFLGATAARNFGPLMYFVTGTEFASRELTSWLRLNQH